MDRPPLDEASGRISSYRGALQVVAEPKLKDDQRPDTFEMDMTISCEEPAPLLAGDLGAEDPPFAQPSS